MTDEETPDELEAFDPDDFEAMAEMHQQMKELLAADNVMAWAEVDPTRVRDLFASLFEFNRHTAEILDRISMVLTRLRPEDKGPEEVKEFRILMAKQLDKISASIRTFTVPVDEEEED